VRKRIDITYKIRKSMLLVLRVEMVRCHCSRNEIFFLIIILMGQVRKDNSVHVPVLLSATPQGRMFPEVSHPQALLGSLVSIF